MEEPLNVFDSIELCPTCKLKTNHEYKVYLDASYTPCTKCGRHVKVVYEGKKQSQVEETFPDKTKEEANFKRNADRKYKPREKKEKK